LGRWGYWSYGGNEEQILSDLIADQIEWVVMGRVYSKINQGPWQVRNAVRNQVLRHLILSLVLESGRHGKQWLPLLRLFVQRSNQRLKSW